MEFYFSQILLVLIVYIRYSFYGYYLLSNDSMHSFLSYPENITYKNRTMQYNYLNFSIIFFSYYSNMQYNCFLSQLCFIQLTYILDNQKLVFLFLSYNTWLNCIEKLFLQLKEIYLLATVLINLHCISKFLFT